MSALLAGKCVVQGLAEKEERHSYEAKNQRWVVPVNFLLGVLCLLGAVACGSGGGSSSSGASAPQPPMGLVYAVSPVIYATGVAIPINTASYSGGPAASFSIDPSLPAGLSLNTQTGSISGTPTQISPAISYQVTALNSAGKCSGYLNISVLDALTGPLTYAQNPVNYTIGVTISPNTPTYTRGVPVNFQIAPPLPQGLSMDATTGSISGTPVTTSPVTTYTISAVDQFGTITCPLIVSVNDLPPIGLGYPQPLEVMTKGVPITPFAPSGNTGGAVTNYTVTPALPDGLSLDPRTGMISGTPSIAMASYNCIITASNSSGSWPIGLGFAINDVTGGWTYSADSVRYTLGQAITPNVPYFSGWAPRIFTVSPALPQGLNLDAQTGVITGTPTQLTVSGTYKITAVDSGVSTDHNLQIAIVDVPPSGLSYTPATANYLISVPIAPVPPICGGGAVTSYSVWPPLPTGLNIDTITGVLSGTPAEVTAPATYSVEALNSGGYTFFNLVIGVVDNPPTSLGYPFASFTFSAGTSYGGYAPWNGGGSITQYSVSPPLPSGITLQPTSGILVANPTVPSPTQNYTITGTNTGGTVSCVIAITVN